MEHPLIAALCRRFNLVQEQKEPWTKKEDASNPFFELAGVGIGGISGEIGIAGRILKIDDLPIRRRRANCLALTVDQYAVIRLRRPRPLGVMGLAVGGSVMPRRNSQCGAAFHNGEGVLIGVTV